MKILSRYNHNTGGINGELESYVIISILLGYFASKTNQDLQGLCGLVIHIIQDIYYINPAN